MKRVKLIIGFLICLPVALIAQQQTGDLQKAEDLQKVKDALVNSVLYCQELEKQNASLNAIIKRVAEDLKKVNTVEQLDSLKVVYGIEVQKKPVKKDLK